ncbi:MAG: NAD(P)/FAD-dependent oxidoreductase [Planctomycetes bacterium]|nr:NAD(P)/FAD-dependent oxidoreductase [Planctomycetota bacterium]
MTEKFGVIVIGSGIGGMTAALVLARKGVNVLLLDQAKKFGGYMNPFSRKGYHFDVGLHYIGECAPGQSFHRLISSLGLEDKIKFRELSEDGFDRYVFPGFETSLCKGAERYADRLKGHFPAEKKGIDTYFAQMRELDQLTRAMSKKMGVGAIWQILRYGLPALSKLKMSFTELVSKWIKDPMLRSVLAAACGDIGLPPSEASGVGLMLVTNHYLGGGYYPVGGSGAIRDAMIDALKEQGATLKNNSEVTEIVIKEGAAVGVKLASGEEYSADAIVSNLDAAVTFGSIVEREHLSNKLAKKVETLSHSFAHIGLFIATDMDITQCGMTDANIWHYDDVDIDSLFKPLHEGRVPKKVGFFLTATTLKDPEGKRAPEGVHTLEGIILAPFEPFRKWMDLPRKKRGEDYESFKKELSEPLFDKIERTYLPGLRGKVLHSEASTPVTNYSYTKNPSGAIYGPSHTPAQMGLNRFPVKTEIKNLFLAGASVLGCGVVPCAISGKMAAAHALKALPRN